MSNIKFSIIVPVYNTKESFLTEALNSLCNQKYDNYETIVVDDGSNDETKTILNNYKNNNNFIIVHQNNQGQMASRLNGVKIATGDYVVFIDSDDYVNDMFLFDLNNIIKQYNCDVIMYDSNRFINYVDNIIDSPHGFFKNGVVTKDEAMIQLLSFHISALWDKCIKRTIINTNINSETSSFRNGEDLEQSTSIILQANSFYYSDSIKYYYRFNEETREYYDNTNLKDINYPVATYKKVFIQNSNYNKYLPIYKQSTIKTLIRTAALIVKNNEDKSSAIELLNKLNEQEIVSIIDSIKIKTSLVYEIMYKIIKYKYYYFLKLISLFIV